MRCENKERRSPSGSLLLSLPYSPFLHVFITSGTSGLVNYSHRPFLLFLLQGSPPFHVYLLLVVYQEDIITVLPQAPILMNKC